MSSVNKLKPTVTFNFVNPRKALVALLLRHSKNPNTRINFEYVERNDPVNGERIWWGDNSGLWWERFEKDHILPNCKPLVFKCFSDGTSTLTNGYACPIVFTLANFDPALQARICGKVLIGFIPYVDSDGDCSSAAVTKCRYRLFHFCMKVLGEYLWPQGGSTVTHLMFRDEFVSFQLVCKNLIMDGPESRKAALIGSECIRCRRPRNTFDRVGHESSAGSSSAVSSASEEAESEKEEGTESESCSIEESTYDNNDGEIEQDLNRSRTQKEIFF